MPPLQFKTQKKPHHMQQKNLHPKTNPTHNQPRIQMPKQKLPKTKRNLQIKRTPKTLPQTPANSASTSIIKIGHLHYNKHQTINQIKQSLNKRPVRKLVASLFVC